ncbi:hypothetical protein SAMN05444166_3590 [Singulisphaera sp. GP187]|nr:hypothetical protein SAMN05444166_3590 [Singulisphaera sp. GP187]
MSATGSTRMKETFTPGPDVVHGVRQYIMQPSVVCYPLRFDTPVDVTESRDSIRRLLGGEWRLPNIVSAE